MELMAVPKKKVMIFIYFFVKKLNMDLKFQVFSSSKTYSLFLQVSRHKRGIRNGPKALKPVPVIVRCK